MKKLLLLSVITLSVLFFGCKETNELPNSVDPTSLGATPAALTNSAWEQLSSFPAGGTAGIGLSIGNKGYIGVGPGVNSSLTDFFEYDPLTNKWTKKASYPGGNRSGSVTFTIGNKGYICLGSALYKNDLWEYDPTTDKWTRKADLPLPTTPFFASTVSGFTIGNKGYVGVFCGTLNLYEYNAEQNVWTKKAGLATGNRSGAVAFSIGNKGYVGLGQIPSNTIDNKYTNELWEYNPNTNAWIRKADFPDGGRTEAIAFTIDSKAYVGTGVSGNSEIQSSYKSDIWQYDPVSNTWTQLDLGTGPSGRWVAVGFSIGNSGYMGTGLNQIGTRYRSDFWKFSVQ